MNEQSHEMHDDIKMAMKSKIIQHDAQAEQILRQTNDWLPFRVARLSSFELMTNWFTVDLQRFQTKEN